MTPQAKLVGGIIIATLVALWVPTFFDGKGLDAVPSVPGIRHDFDQDFMPVSEPIDPQQSVWNFDNEIEDLRQKTDAIKASPEHLALPDKSVVRDVEKPMGELSGTGFDDTGLPEAWVVQLGVFSNKNNALSLKRRVDMQFTKAGHRTILDLITRDGKTLYRLSVGPFLDQVTATTVLAILQQEGISERPLVKKFSLIRRKNQR